MLFIRTSHPPLYLSIILEGGRILEASRIIIIIIIIKIRKRNSFHPTPPRDQTIPFVFEKLPALERDSIPERESAAARTSSNESSVPFGRVTPPPPPPSPPTDPRGWNARSGGTSVPPLGPLACRTRVARLVGNASSRRKVARGDGAEGRKKERGRERKRERNGYRERETRNKK